MDPHPHPQPVPQPSGYVLMVVAPDQGQGFTVTAVRFSSSQAANAALAGLPSAAKSASYVVQDNVQ